MGNAPVHWPHKYSKDFLDRTIQAWQRDYKEPLTYQDAEEITDNLVGFFKILLRWDEEFRAKGILVEEAASGQPAPAATDPAASASRPPPGSAGCGAPSGR